MLQLDPKAQLPTSAELPCSDDIPVDNEDQNLLPNYLLFLLQRIWAERQDWFFAVDMAIYHTTGKNPRVPVVPDAFLSLGVERKKNGESRLSYVMWEENNVPPVMVLEMVSHTSGGEYDKKLEIYRKLGVLYYLIYNPKHWKRDGHQPFEMYRLVNGVYQLQRSEPFWMSEAGLGIGRRLLPLGGLEQEGLSWCAQSGNPYLGAEEVAEQERQRRQRAEQERDRLAAKLRELGVDPDQI